MKLMEPIMKDQRLFLVLKVFLWPFHHICAFFYVMRRENDGFVVFVDFNDLELLTQPCPPSL